MWAEKSVCGLSKIELTDREYELKTFSLVVPMQLKLEEIIGFKFLFDFSQSAFKKFVAKIDLSKSYLLHLLKIK